jgi:hypothetical protein
MKRCLVVLLKIKFRQLSVKKCVRKWCKGAITCRQKNDAKMRVSDILGLSCALRTTCCHDTLLLVHWMWQRWFGFTALWIWLNCQHLLQIVIDTCVSSTVRVQVHYGRTIQKVLGLCVVCMWLARLFGPFAVFHLDRTVLLFSKYTSSLSGMCFGNFLEMLTEPCVYVKCCFVWSCFSVSLKSLVKETTRALAGTHLNSFRCYVCAHDALHCAHGALQIGSVPQALYSPPCLITLFAVSTNESLFQSMLTLVSSGGTRKWAACRPSRFKCCVELWKIWNPH